MSPRAKVYVWVILVLGGASLVWGLGWLPDSDEDWMAFAVLVAAAATAQYFPVVTPKNQAYYLTTVFIFAGLFLLPPGGLALLIVLAFIPEWVKARYPWYIQLFNIANFLLDAFVAGHFYFSVTRIPGGLPTSLFSLVVAVLAAGVFAVMNHLLLAIVLNLARGHSWRQSGLFEWDNYLTDATLAAIGIAAALLWQINPWLLALVGAPLFLIYRALNMPNLQEQARTDPKTGLYNTRRFFQVLDEELKRAIRFDHPLAIIMADLDLLRNINNTYGHLAGDAALVEVARIIKASLREYDVPARFGGEEFAILLPETDADRALVVAERLRKQIEAARCVIPTSVEPIRVTISLGVAAYPTHGIDPNDLIHQADLAVYYAKLQGRNRSWVCSRESRVLSPVVAHRLDLPLTVAATGRADGRVHEQAHGHPGKSGRLAAGGRAPSVDTPPERASGSPGSVVGQRTSRRERATDLSWPAASLVGTVAGLALGLWLLCRPWEHLVNWPTMLVLAALTVASQYLAVETYGRGKVSIGGIFVLAGGFLFGLPGALVPALVLAISTWIPRRDALHRTLFDLGNTTLWGAAAAAVFGALVHGAPLAWPVHLLAAWEFIAAGLAAIVYYVVNVGLLCLVFALIERRSPVSVWIEKFRWLFPYYVAFGGLALLIALAYRTIGIPGLLAFVAPPFMMRYAIKQYINRTVESVAEVKRVNEKLVAAHDEMLGMLREFQATYDSTLTALSTALDSRDSETEGHSQRVVKYAAAVARQLGLTEPETRKLLKGALLHDVGKIGVPDVILRKPGPLTAAEWAVMRTHAERGYQMLKPISFLRDSLPVIRYHHERYDGKGYPSGLRGEEIPLGARIFAVVDAFDAMTSDRPYRRALSLETARRELTRGAGIQFDPVVVEAFLAVDERELASVIDELSNAPGIGEDSMVVGPPASARGPRAADASLTTA